MNAACASIVRTTRRSRGRRRRSGPRQTPWPRARPARSPARVRQANWECRGSRRDADTELGTKSSGGEVPDPQMPEVVEGHDRFAIGGEGAPRDSWVTKVIGRAPDFLEPGPRWRFHPCCLRRQPTGRSRRRGRRQRDRRQCVQRQRDCWRRDDSRWRDRRRNVDPGAHGTDTENGEAERSEPRPTIHSGGASFYCSVARCADRANLPYNRTLDMPERVPAALGTRLEVD